jgi:uncharacterized protein (UPF0332 family)
MDTVEISSVSSEYELRNSLSRLYYAFFHASLALLMGTDPDAEKISRDHGAVHDRYQQRMGIQPMGRLFRELYRFRRESDYDTTMFETRYRGNVEQGRKELILFLKRVKTDFFWMYREARKAL